MFGENPSEDTGDIMETYILGHMDWLTLTDGSMDRGVQNI